MYVPKKVILLLVFLLSLLFLSACSSNGQEKTANNVEEENQQENAEKPADEDKEEEEESSNKEEVKSNQDSENSEEESTEETEINTSLIDALKPNKPVKKTFIQNDEFTLTETIVDMNDEYLQRVFQLGDMVTLQVLKWDNEVIQVVYEQSNPDSPEESILDDFAPNKEEQPMADSNRSLGDPSGWKLVSDNETVTVPYKTFEGVYSVRSKISEGNTNTIHTVYFAPGIGMIKEVFEETGDDGYTVESVLENVESL
ncbi:hypothetical protein V1502_18390 [Bacillus sp. SCS-153A]|uniref:hypothetical protein n=1 Tax=Rossellomorea sedimentorum TaxID=3115294 RepID=UPI00390620FD